ncbi:MAG: SMP-30/gluconolactonase/LRE family protein [Bryobacterales bacterium]|nr:SMP-30/gluconolactonase/LRE family protein [Bryobacterales bacterium]
MTDSFQGLIYRIPTGGGAPQVWFQHPNLLGNPQMLFGVNGIRFDEKNKHVYFSVTVRNDFSGATYRLAVVNNPSAADLEEFAVYPATQQGPLAPDGIAFTQTGRLVVALAGSSQISILRQNGKEALRLSGPADNGKQGTLPRANPANIAFNDDERTILVTNHASLVPFDPNLFALIEVFIKEKGQ